MQHSIRIRVSLVGMLAALCFISAASNPARADKCIPYQESCVNQSTGATLYACCGKLICRKHRGVSPPHSRPYWWGTCV
jgi:hypothetical protein